MNFAKMKYILPLFLGMCFFSFSQQSIDNNKYEEYDAIVGIENTGLFNGTEFRDLYVNTDKTYRYFNQIEFTEGSIVYCNQLYSKVLMRYDLLEDNVIIKSNDNLSLFNVKLQPERIEHFSINSHQFVQLSNTKLDFEDHNFFEVLYLGNTLNMYIKQLKKKRKNIVGSDIEYSFTQANFHLLFYKDTYYEIRSIRDLQKAMPENEAQIRSFYSSYSSLYKSDIDVFMLKLSRYLDGGNSTNG